MKTMLLLAILPVFLDWTAAIQYYYMEDYCGGTLDISWQGSILLQLARSRTYRPSMNCSVVITTSNLTYVYDRLMLHFTDMNIESSVSCTRDWLEVRDGKTPTAHYVDGFQGKQCGSYITNAVKTTTGANLFLRFVSDSTWQSSGFSMVIVQYHTGNCYPGEHSCSYNDRCIPSDLVCNGYNPCGDYSDCDVILAAGAIAGIVIGCILFVVFALIVLTVCCRRTRRMTYINM